jgi:hypothetical protein
VKAVIITLESLRELGITPEEIVLFASAFLKGVEVSLENLLRAYEVDFDVEAWFNKAFPDSVNEVTQRTDAPYATYENRVVALEEECRQRTNPLIEEHNQRESILRDKHAREEGSLRDKYERGVAALPWRGRRRQAADLWQTYCRAVNASRQQLVQELNALWGEHQQQVHALDAEYDSQIDAVWEEFDRRIAIPIMWELIQQQEAPSTPAQAPAGT